MYFVGVVCVYEHSDAPTYAGRFRFVSTLTVQAENSSSMTNRIRLPHLNNSTRI